MVGMEMGDEDVGDLHEREIAPVDLALRTLATVHQHHLVTEDDGRGRNVPLLRGPCPAGPEEYQTHVS